MNKMEKIGEILPQVIAAVAHTLEEVAEEKVDIAVIVCPTSDAEGDEHGTVSVMGANCSPERALPAIKGTLERLESEVGANRKTDRALPSMDEPMTLGVVNVNPGGDETAQDLLPEVLGMVRRLKEDETGDFFKMLACVSLGVIGHVEGEDSARKLIDSDLWQKAVRITSVMRH